MATKLSFCSCNFWLERSNLNFCSERKYIRRGDLSGKEDGPAHLPQAFLLGLFPSQTQGSLYLWGKSNVLFLPSALQLCNPTVFGFLGTGFLSSPGCSGTYPVCQAGHDLRDSPATSQPLQLKTCITTPGWPPLFNQTSSFVFRDACSLQSWYGSCGHAPTSCGSSAPL